LPADIAQLIGAIREQGPAPVLPTGTPLAESLTATPPKAPAFGFTMPAPRAVAVAVMGMLGFGVIVGSLVGGTSVASLASAPLIVVGMAHPASSAPAAGGGEGGGLAGGPTTITNYVGASGVSAAPAATSAPAAATPAASQASTSAGSSSTAGAGNGGSSSAAGSSTLPPVKHVFLIVLSDRGFNQSFGPTAAKGYLNGALRRQGELVQDYYAVASSPLANEIAMVSGQGPTPETSSDCPVFSRLRPGTKGPRGQVLGAGCVYPPATRTLAGQLSAAGDSWKAYVQGASGARTACQVPKTGSKVPQVARTNTTYLAWRNPFVYFRSLTAGAACRRDEVGIGQLAKDLKSAKSTPSLAYVIPAPCADGSEAPCKRGAKPSLAGANTFLRTVVPEIKRSPGYKDGGLIAITFDQAPQTGPDADASACCNSPTYPNLRDLPAPDIPPAAMESTAASTGPTSTGATTTGAATTGSAGSTTTTPATTGSGSTASTTPGTTTTGTTGPTTPATTGSGPTASTTPATTTTGTTGSTTPATTNGTTSTTTGSTTAPTTTTAPASTTTPAVSLGSGQTTPTGGGGQVGLLVISPYVKPNSVDVVDYFNHFSLLASIEDLFGLKHLGYAGAAALPVFGAAVYNNYAG
jgi:phosphatidylinositol-3-phosphatase